MMQLPTDTKRKLKTTMEALRQDRLPWWNHWRELADYILPRRYVWLMSNKEKRQRDFRNRYILDSTGTIAARTLAAGMMNGITSPARPWFRLRIPGINAEQDVEVQRWLDTVQQRMLLIMSESNFYNAMAVMYQDLVVFGTSCMLIYEDRSDVIRCYNLALGEYYLAQSSRLQVNTVAREFCYKVHQVVERWGLENCSPRVQQAYKDGGARLQDEVAISHLIEPNIGDKPPVAKTFDFREYYWESESADDVGVLAVNGYRDFPALAPRWEILGNDAYGTSPGMDALGDIIQLQHETKKKAQGLDKLISPPMVADIMLKNKPTSLLPNGVTYVSGSSNVGMKTAYQINVPLAEISADINDVRLRIRETFHNDLFRMISNLDTVRSATEISAREEEKLVLLGSVLERFENESLDPAVARVFNIMNRGRMFPPPPANIQGRPVQVQYVGVLSDAQRAVGTVSMERYAAVLGNVATIDPEVVNTTDFKEFMREYGRAVNVPGKIIRSKDEEERFTQQQRELRQMQQQSVIGETLVGAAKQLSETEVGGGNSALQEILGN